MAWSRGNMTWPCPPIEQVTMIIIQIWRAMPHFWPWFLQTTADFIYGWAGKKQPTSSDHHLVTPQCRMKYRRLWSTTSVRCSSGTGDRYGIWEARIFATRLSWREGWETVHPAGVFGAKPSSRSFENVVSRWKDEIWNKIPWFFNQNPGLKHI